MLLVGRSEDKLKATTQEIGAAGYYVLDTGDIASIPSFIEKITSEHPELDCLINNAGVQRPFQVLGPDYGFDLCRLPIRRSTSISAGRCTCPSDSSRTTSTTCRTAP